MATTAGFAIMFEPGSTKCWHLHLQVLYQESVFTEEKKAGMQSFLVNCIGSFLLAVTSILCVYYLPGTMDLNVIIIASIMPLVPGVAITNAVYDTLHGDYISGAARMLEAFVTAAPSQSAWDLACCCSVRWCGRENRYGKKMRLKQKYENSR